MKTLVTGSAGHLGEALVRTLRGGGRDKGGHDVVGLDIVASPFTDIVGSITDLQLVLHCMQGIDAVMHTATLHKPHVATHTRQQFIDTNISGTLNLLEAAVASNVRAFIFTSTTSAFGDALTPAAGAPATWITEDITPIPKNIYGATKTAAEDLCQLFQRNHGLPCVVLRTSRFFPEHDDDPSRREALDIANLQAIEYLYRRVDIEDVVDAHIRALQQAPNLGFDKFIISANSPFTREDLAELRTDVGAVLRRRVPAYESIFADHGWCLPTEIDRLYVNEKARNTLKWQPQYDFARILNCLRDGVDPSSPMARVIGWKGYHPGATI